LFFISSGFSGSSGAQSDGATIQLARIFTGSAQSADPAASRTAQASINLSWRMISPIKAWFFRRQVITADPEAAMAVVTNDGELM
jgi:hypothetical protein